MDSLAHQLNKIIQLSNPYVFEMLSEIGKKLFFPKGILTQSAEAKENATAINATIGIAKENNKPMYIDTITSLINNITPDESLTYAPSFGISNLRKLWKKSIDKKNPSIDINQISLPIVTCGITHALSTFSDIWVNPKDIIILPDMMWGNYNMILSTRKNAKITHYKMFSKNNEFNLKDFEKKIHKESYNNEKIIVLLNFPHNPTGYTPTKKEAYSIAKILTTTAEKGNKIIAVTDDSYFGFFYENDTFKESIFSLLYNKHEKLLAVKLDGATKENFAWGLRIGFITYGCSIINKKNKAPFFNALETKTGGNIRGNISSASHLSQTLLLKAMKNPKTEEQKIEKFHIMQKRSTKIKNLINDKKFKSAWTTYPFNSGYFVCIKLKTVNAEKLRIHLLKKYGIGIISIDNEKIRIAYSSIETSEIQKLLEIIFIGIKDMEKN